MNNTPNLHDSGDKDDPWSGPTIREYTDDEILWMKIVFLVAGHLMMLGEMYLFDAVANELSRWVG